MDESIKITFVWKNEEIIIVEVKIDETGDIECRYKFKQESYQVKGSSITTVVNKIKRQLQDVS